MRVSPEPYWSWLTQVLEKQRSLTIDPSVQLRTPRLEEKKMSRFRSFGKLIAIVLGLAVLTPSSYVEAKKRPGKKEEPAAEPTPIKKRKIVPRPRALRWNMTPEQVAKVYDAVIDKDNLHRFKDVQPGIQMTRLKNQIAEMKANFRRTKLTFTGVPTKYDSKPVGREYTHKNKEALMTITRKRKGRTRYLLFIQNKLWKIIDVYPLKKKGKYGDTFATASAKINKIIRLEGRKRDPDAAKGRHYAELDWADAKIHLRVVDWSARKNLAIIYEDKATLAKIDTLRANKPKKEEELDPSVKKAIRK